jgi:hypothetical protein
MSRIPNTGLNVCDARRRRSCTLYRGNRYKKLSKIVRNPYPGTTAKLPGYGYCRAPTWKQGLSFSMKQMLFFSVLTSFFCFSLSVGKKLYFPRRRSFSLVPMGEKVFCYLYGSILNGEYLVSKNQCHINNCWEH